MSSRTRDYDRQGVDFGPNDGRSSSSEEPRPRKKPKARRFTSDTQTTYFSDTEYSHPQVQAINTHQLIARLLTRDSGDYGASFHSSLLIISARLDSESRRASEAEHRNAVLLARVRTSDSALALSQQEAARTAEELRLYKIQLDAAQQEILRAQGILNDVEKQRDEAEAEAARARTTARKLKEDWLVQSAREEGRRRGYEEGLRRGRRFGFDEGRDTGYNDLRAPTDELDDETWISRPMSAPRESIQVRRPVRVASPTTSTIPQVIRPAPPRPASAPIRHQSRRRDAPPPVPAFQAPHVPDVAPRALSPPVTTLTTPFRMPSPSHVNIASDAPLHSPQPRRATDIDPASNTPPTDRSPAPPEFPSVIREPGISEADPRPRPLSVAPNFSPWEVVTRPLPEPNSSRRRRETPGHSGLVPPSLNPFSTVQVHNVRVSPASQRISEFELVSPPTFAQGQRLDSTLRDVLGAVPVPSKSPDEDFMMADHRPSSPTSEESSLKSSPARVAGPRPIREAVQPVPLGTVLESQPHLQAQGVSWYGPGHGPPRPPTRSDSRSRTPIDWLFRKRKSGRSSTPTVPQIAVEPPSETPSDTSVPSPGLHGNLLTPEHANQPLPIFPNPDEVFQAAVATVSDSPVLRRDRDRHDRRGVDSDFSDLPAIAPAEHEQPPLGVLPVRTGPDYFSSTLEHIPISAPVPFASEPPSEDGAPARHQHKRRHGHRERAHSPERRAETPLTPRTRAKYAEAPLPPGLAYPDPPMSLSRSPTPTPGVPVRRAPEKASSLPPSSLAPSLFGSSGESGKSLLRARSPAPGSITKVGFRQDMSPAALGRPISLFSED